MGRVWRDLSDLEIYLRPFDFCIKAILITLIVVDGLIANFGIPEGKIEGSMVAINYIIIGLAAIPLVIKSVVAVGNAHMMSNRFRPAD